MIALVVVTMAGLEVDGFVLLVSKLSKQRIQTATFTRATRISRHGWEVDVHQEARAGAVDRSKSKDWRTMFWEQVKRSGNQYNSGSCSADAKRTVIVVAARCRGMGGLKEMEREEKNVFVDCHLSFESSGGLVAAGANCI